jgi:hypothetical protein
MVEAGLIKLEKRGRATHIVLEDKAWYWAQNNFGVELSLSKYAVPVLQALLVKIGLYLNVHEIPLAEMMTASKATDTVDEPTHENISNAGASGLSTNDLIEKVRQAYFSIPDGEAGFRVRLSHLREHLPGLSKQQINQALLSMQDQGEISLLATEDLHEITAEDESSAIDMGGGDKRYFAFMKR